MTFLEITSEYYPSLLKQIYDPPRILWVKGEYKTWEERQWVAVVGARKASQWGLQMAKKIVSEFVDRGFGIVSGLAYGIDAMAHQACLEKGGVTWAVLGSGIDWIYPKRNTGLAKKIMEKGCVLTEFPPGTQPYASHFPQRNRIISGLSQAVIVVEGSIQSGALITARFALDQGREVFVVVPPNRDVCYAGNYRLLEDGATPIGEYEPPPSEPAPKRDSLLLSCLKRPRSLDYLMQKTNKKSFEILAELLQLESEGLVKKIPGPLWQSL